MAVVTVFKNFTHPVEDVSLIILSNWLASDKYKPLVEEIRCLIAQGLPDCTRQNRRSTNKEAAASGLYTIRNV